MESQPQEQFESPTPEGETEAEVEALDANNENEPFCNEQYTPPPEPVPAPAYPYWNPVMNPMGPNPEGRHILARPIYIPPSPTAFPPRVIPYHPGGSVTYQVPTTSPQDFVPMNYQNNCSELPMTFPYNIGAQNFQPQSPIFQNNGAMTFQSKYPIFQHGPGTFFVPPPSMIPQAQSSPTFQFQGGYPNYGVNPAGIGTTGDKYLPYNVAIIDELMQYVNFGAPSSVADSVPVQEQTQNNVYGGLGNNVAGFAGVKRQKAATPRARKSKNKKYCAFCLANNETEEVWSSHCVGGNGITTCPVLQKYVCPICGQTGEQAHTIKYCPKNDGSHPGHVHVITGRNAAGLMTRRHFVNGGKRH